MQPPCAASASLPRFDRCQPVAGTSSCPAATLYATTVSSSAVDSAASSSSSTFVVSSTATLSERTTEILEHLERQRVELSVKYTEYENNIAAGILPPGTDEYHGKKLKTSYNNYVQLKAMDMTVTNPLIDEWARSAYGNIVNELRAIDSKIKAELKRQQLAKIAASAPAKVFGPLRSNELPNTLPKETSSSVEDLIGIPLEFIYDHIVPYFSTLECAMCPRTTGIYGDAYILERDDCEPQYSCAEHILDITTDWRRTRILRARGNEKATLYKVHATLVIADRVIAIPQAPVRFGGFVTLLVTHVIMSCQFRSVRYVRITPERDSFTTNTFEVQLMNPNERSKWTVHKTVTRSTRGTSSGGLASIVKAVGTHCAACRTPTGVQAAALLPCSCCGHRAADVHPRPSAVKALSQIKHCAQMETSMSNLLERRIALAHDARQHHQPVPTLPQDHVLMIKMVNDRKNEGPNDDSGIVGDESDGGKSDQEDDEEDEEDHDDRTVFKMSALQMLDGEAGEDGEDAAVDLLSKMSDKELLDAFNSRRVEPSAPVLRTSKRLKTSAPVLTVDRTKGNSEGTSDDDDESPDHDKRRLNTQSRNVYKSINAAIEPLGVVHAVNIPASTMKILRDLYEQNHAEYLQYVKQQAQAKASTRQSITSRNKGTVNRHVNHAPFQQAQANVANSETLAVVLNGELIGPEQLREMAANLSAEERVASFKTGHLNTLAGLKPRGGEDVLRSRQTFRDNTQLTMEVLWDILFADATRKDGSVEAQAGRDVLFARMREAQRVANRTYHVPLPLLRDTPEEYERTVLSSLGLDASSIKVVDGDVSRRHANVCPTIGPSGRPDVAHCAGTWTFAYVQELQSVILRYHNDHRDALDHISILLAIWLYAMEGNSGGDTAINIFTVQEQAHVRALIAEGVTGLTYTQDPGVIDDAPILHAETNQMRLGEVRVQTGVALAANLANRGHTATAASSTRKPGSYGSGTLGGTSAFTGLRGMHISHNSAPALALLYMLSRYATYKHKGTTSTARLTLQDEYLGLMIDNVIPLSEQAIYIALHAKNIDLSINYRPRSITYKQNGVVIKLELSPARLLDCFTSKLNVQFGRVQRMCSRLGITSLEAPWLRSACTTESDVERDMRTQGTKLLETAVDKLSSALATHSYNVPSKDLLEMFVYNTAKHERSVAAAAAQSLADALQNGSVARALSLPVGAPIHRPQMAAALATALAMPMYLTTTVVLPLLGSNQYHNHERVELRAAYQGILHGYGNLFHHRLLAPSHTSLASSTMVQESLAKDVASATFRERCACASLATYFQTDVLSYLVKKPLAAAMGTVLGTVVQLMASGNLREAEAIASATQSVHALVKPALKDEDRSYKIIKIRTNGKKRRYQLGNWKRCLAVLAQSGWTALNHLHSHAETTWASIYDTFKTTLMGKGAAEFLCMKHTSNSMLYQVLPSSTIIYDCLPSCMHGPGSLKMLYVIDGVINGSCTWQDGLAQSAKTLTPKHLGYDPVESYACTARLIPLLALPSWKARVALDPVLDDLTPDAAICLCECPPGEVGESLYCDAIARGGRAAAASQGLAEPATKAGINPAEYFHDDEVRKRDLRRVVHVCLSENGAIIRRPHTHVAALYAGMTAVKLNDDHMTIAAQLRRASVHDAAQRNAARVHAAAAAAAAAAAVAAAH